MYTYIYEYQGKLFDRMAVTFDEGVMKDFNNRPGDKAELWEGNHFYASMDSRYT